LKKIVKEILEDPVWKWLISKETIDKNFKLLK
jgi:hypothetical protein